MKKLKAIALDDEQRPLNSLKLFLEELDFIDLVSAVQTLEEAKEDILYHKPEILFLDIMIKDEPVFPMLERIKKRTDLSFSIIFITAFEDKFIKKAMEVCQLKYTHAYIHKPFNELKLKQMLWSYYRNYQEKRIISSPKESLKIPFQGGFHVVPYHEIIYCESDGSDCIIAIENPSRKIFPRMTISLTALAEELPTSMFFKMSSKYIVNKKKLIQAKTSRKHKHVCYLEKANGKIIELPVPEKKWKALKDEFEVRKLL